jgi:hypothetical protein
MTDAVPSTDQPAEIQLPASAEPAAPESEVIVDVKMPALGAASAEPPADDETADGRTYRQRILDAFEDNEGDLTVVQIMQDTGLSRNAVDSTLSVMVKRGLVLRVAQGLYRRAPPAPTPELLPAPVEQPRADGVSVEQWLEWLWAWYQDGKWQGPGSPPGRVDGIVTANCVVPLDAWMVFVGQIDAVLKQQAEDDVLRDRLVACANGNVRMGSPLQDMRAVKIVLASGLSIEDLEFAVRQQFDRRHNPKAGMLSSWADLFPRAAKNYALSTVPKLVARWNTTLADPGATTDKSPTLRRAMAEIAPQPAARASEPVPAVPQPLAPEAAPALSPTEPAANPAGGEMSEAAMLMQRFGGGLRDAVDAVSADDDDTPPAMPPSRPTADGRDAVLTRFARSRPGAAPAMPPPPARADRSEIAERVKSTRAPNAVPVTSEPIGVRPRPAAPPHPADLYPDEYWDEIVDSYSQGFLRWPPQAGSPPDHPDTKVPAQIRRRYGFRG